MQKYQIFLNLLKQILTAAFHIYLIQSAHYFIQIFLKFNFGLPDLLASNRDLLIFYTLTVGFEVFLNIH